MSRSGYTDDCDGDGADLAMWRGVIASATRGKRGQRFFRDLVAALDAMPVKRLVAHEFETPEGDVCALGCLARARGVPMPSVIKGEWDDEPEADHDELAATFDIAAGLAAEVMYHNDEWGNWRGPESPEQRWARVRKWVASQIRVTPDELQEDER